MAEDLDGKVQKASGASKFAKGDVRKARDIRAECKTTSFRSYSLKLADWRKVQGEALSGGLEAPVMQIEFQGQSGQNSKLAVIDWSYFLELRRTEEQMEEAKWEAKALQEDYDE